jgi:hypothetical protein
VSCRTILPTFKTKASGGQRPSQQWCLVPVCEHGHGGCDDVVHIGFSLGGQCHFSSCLALLDALDGDTQQPLCDAPISRRPAITWLPYGQQCPTRPSSAVVCITAYPDWGKLGKEMPALQKQACTTDKHAITSLRLAFHALWSDNTSASNLSQEPQGDSGGV